MRGGLSTPGVAVLANGDRITGEIVELMFGHQTCPLRDSGRRQRPSSAGTPAVTRCPHDRGGKGESPMRALPVLAAVMVLLGAACTTTVQRTVEQSPAICGFLGMDVCAELRPGARGEAGLRYVNPKAMFTQYDKVLVVVVGFFGSDPAKVPPRDEQRLTDLFYKTLREAGQAVSAGGRGRARGDEARGRAPRCRGGDAGGPLGHDGGPAPASAQRRLRRRGGDLPVRGGRSGHRQGLGSHDRGDPGGRRGSAGRGWTS